MQISQEVCAQKLWFRAPQGRRIFAGIFRDCRINAGYNWGSNYLGDGWIVPKLLGGRLKPAEVQGVSRQQVVESSRLRR
jgi:hypothetical protein